MSLPAELLAALRDAGGNVTRAAEAMGIGRVTLHQCYGKELSAAAREIRAAAVAARRAVRLRPRLTYTYTCAGCGRTLTAPTRRRRWCSPRCRMAAVRSSEP